MAVLIRVYRYGAVPGGMNQDGAMAAVDAKALALYGTDRLGMRYPVHLTAWGFGQMSPLLSYLMAPFVKTLGLSVSSARLPSLLISLGGLAALFAFSYRSFGRAEALVILLVAAINPWHIIQSRWAIDCNLFPHFLMAGMFFLTIGAEKKAMLYAAMAFFGFSMYCYGISLYTVPLFLLCACVWLVCSEKIKLRDAILPAVLYLLISWPFYACMALNFFGLETIETPFFTIPFFPDSIRSNDILFFSQTPLRQLGANIISTLRILGQFYNGYLCNEVRGFGTMYLFSIPFMIAGAVSLLRQFRKNAGAAFVWLMFLTGLFDGMITSNVNINRINLIFYPLIVFTGAGITAVLRFAERDGQKVKKITAAVLAVIYFSGFALFTKTYFTSYADKISISFMQDFGEAVSSVKDTDAAHFCITPDAQYDGFWYVSEVLTLFYHDTDAKYYQSDEFKERYTFRNPSGLPDEDTVYVLKSDYADIFEGLPYEVTEYGRFITAVPKKLS